MQKPGAKNQEPQACVRKLSLPPPSVSLSQLGGQPWVSQLIVGFGKIRYQLLWYHECMVSISLEA